MDTGRILERTRAFIEECASKEFTLFKQEMDFGARPPPLNDPVVWEALLETAFSVGFTKGIEYFPKVQQCVNRNMGTP